MVGSMAKVVILASGSPRRAEILTKHGIKFRVIPSPYEEKHTTTVFSYDYVENLAESKALGVLDLVNEPALIVGADTVVVSDGKILGKPQGYAQAYAMLRELSGKTHVVVTAVAVIDSVTGEIKKKSATSHVTFENLTDEQINSYIEKFSPYDKAGAYGIQEMPQGYIKGFEGDLENVIGISSALLMDLLKKFA